MKTGLQIVTKNHGGILNNPFEFRKDGDQKLTKIFSLVCPDTVLENLNIPKRQPQKKSDDKDYGPKVSDIISKNRINQLTEKQRKFIEKNSDKKLFFILHNHTSLLLNADKNIRDAASKGDEKPIRILSTTDLLNANASQAIDDVYEDILNLKNSTETIVFKSDDKKTKNLLADEDRQALITEFGDEDAEWLCTEEGQLLFFALLEAMNLKLCQNELKTINAVKAEFKKNLGDADKKAENTLSRINKQSVAMVQECDKAFIEKIKPKKTFWRRIVHYFNGVSYWDISGQKSKGSSASVLLKKSDWLPPSGHIKPLVIDFKNSYGTANEERYNEGKVNGVLARNKETGVLTFSVSCHSKENKYQEKDGKKELFGTNDALEQLNAALKEWEKLQIDSRENIVLLIGGDFNTKQTEDLTAIKKFCQQNKLHLSSTGPTSIKQRAVTVQQKKAGVDVIVEEDFVITSCPTIAEKARPKKDAKLVYLPSKENFSDHTEVVVSIARENFR